MSSPTFVDLTVTDTATINTLNCTISNTTDLITTNATINNIVTNSITTDASGIILLGDSSDIITIEGSIVNIGLAGGIVNLLGTTTYIDTQNTLIKDALITLNNGGSSITAIGSGIEIEGTSNVIVASLKLDNNLDFIVDSQNDKLTCSNIVCTNLSGLATVSASVANITTAYVNSLTVTGLTNMKGDIILGDSTLDSLTCNASATFSGIYNNGTITTDNLTATSIVGTLTTSAQPNITSVGILNGLQVTGNLLVGSLGTNLYVNNMSGKVGFGTGSTLSSSSKVEVVGGLKCDTLEITSLNPSSITTANLTVLDNTILGNISTDTLTVNATSAFNANITANNSMVIGTSNVNVLTCNAKSEFYGGIRFRSSQTYDKIYSATGTTTSGQRTFTTPSGMFTSLPTATVSCIVDDLNMRICWIRTATFSAGVATFVCRVVATDNSTVSGVPVNIICIGD